MHKRNITITALVVAAVLAALFQFVPAINRSPLLAWFYFPSILLTVALSGGSHSPSAVAGWSSFLTYTLVYWTAFFAVYALLLEFYLLRSASEHLDGAKGYLMDEHLDPLHAQERIGRAILAVEARRRRHFFLKSTPELDLSLPPAVIAEQALARAPDAPVIRRILKRLESKLAADVGREKAADRMASLRDRGRASPEA